jgi:hypothetical protein
MTGRGRLFDYSVQKRDFQLTPPVGAPVSGMTAGVLRVKSVTNRHKR